MALNSQQLAMEIVAKDLATATLQRVNANVEQFTQTAARAQHGTVKMGEGLNSAARALTGLAGDAVGATGKIGKLAEGLLTFAIGGPVVTAIAAGVLAVVATYGKLTEGAREAKKAVDDLVASQLKASTTSQEQALRNRQVLEQRLADLRREFDEQTRLRDKAKGAGLLTEQFDARLAQLAVELNQARRALAATRGGAVVLNDLTVAAKAAVPAPGLPGGDRNTAFADSTNTGLAADAAARLVEAANQLGPSLAMIGAGGERVYAAAASVDTLADKMGRVATVTTAVGDAFAGLGDVVGGRFGDTARKIIAPFAKIEGTYFIIKGLAKIADSLFPPNPAGLASGSGMIARGRQLIAIAGGGASFGGATGGAGGGGGIDRGQQTIAQQRGDLRVELKKGFVHSTDPDFQDFLVETLRGAGNRRVTVAYV